MTDILALSAFGDAIGVPYEFSKSGLPFNEGLSFKPQLHPPGLWSDDTSMALCIVLAACKNDLRTDVGLNEVVKLFKAWAEQDGGGIGNQTAAVLSKLSLSSPHPFYDAEMAARKLLAKRPNDSAGNGSLMRIHPTALLAMNDKDAAIAAESVTTSTHPDQRCVDASILWTMMLRHALATGGSFKPNVGIDFIPSESRDFWNEAILEALATPSHEFGTRGWWVVPSFQQALSAVHKNLALLSTNPMYIFREILACGPCDSDTICAIAGGLMGALGVNLSQMPEELTEVVHGRWPGMLKLNDLQELERILPLVTWK